MDGKKKKLLIISVVLTGGLLTITSLSAAKFQGSNFNTETPLLSETVAIAPKGVNNVIVNASHYSIKTEESKDNDIKIIYTSSAKDYIEVANKSGDLTINYTDKRKWYEYLKFNIFNSTAKPKKEIMIQLPSRYQGNLQISNDYNPVELNGIKGIGVLTVNNPHDDIVISDTSISKNMSLSGSYSNVKIKNSQIQGRSVIKTEHGDIDIENSELTQQLDCTTNYGNISLLDVDSQQLYLKNKHGGISGNLIGKQEMYSIKSNVKNGDSNLNDNILENGRILEVSTFYGDIEIKFNN